MESNRLVKSREQQRKQKKTEKTTQKLRESESIQSNWSNFTRNGSHQCNILHSICWKLYGCTLSGKKLFHLKWGYHEYNIARLWNTKINVAKKKRREKNKFQRRRLSEKKETKKENIIRPKSKPASQQHALTTSRHDKRKN